MADTELRRRHPDAELPPLHPDEEARQSGHDAEPIREEPSVDQTEVNAAAAPGHQGTVRRDMKAALTAARRVQQIITERERQADRDTRLASDDVMRRREAEAQQEALARRSAVRQDPVPSRRALSLDRWCPGVLRRLSQVMSRCEGACQRQPGPEAAGDPRLRVPL